MGFGPFGVVIVKALVIGSSTIVLSVPVDLPVEENYEMVTSWFGAKGMWGKNDNI